MEEDENSHNQRAENFSNGMQRSAHARNSFGSFKRKKGVSSAVNSGSYGNRGNVDYVRTVSAQYDGPTSLPASMNSSNPGYANPNYSGDGAETSFVANHYMTPGTVPYNQHSGMIRAGPMNKNRDMYKGQPQLAGAGALILGPAQFRSQTPASHNIDKISLQNVSLQEDRVSIYAPAKPAFQPQVPWEYPKEKIYIRLKIGEGNFGEVWRAHASNLLGQPGDREVAVKMLKRNSSSEDKPALLKELEIMKRLQPHPNIISLLGCCTQSGDMCIILEYAGNGSLQSLLRRQRLNYDHGDFTVSHTHNSVPNFTLGQLVQFATHVCCGMEYICSLKLLHRDLASRNVLVDEQFICKICDFGSARDVAHMRQYESQKRSRLPLRWMAPEALLDGISDVTTDVWSFGVLLWEIVTLASTPYPGMSGQEVIQFIQKGCRMARPTQCSQSVYDLMKDCWGQFAPKRPSFSLINQRLGAILQQNINELQNEHLEENMYDILSSMPGEKC